MGTAGEIVAPVRVRILLCMVRSGSHREGRRLGGLVLWTLTDEIG